MRYLLLVGALVLICRAAYNLQRGWAGDTTAQVIMAVVLVAIFIRLRRQTS